MCGIAGFTQYSHHFGDRETLEEMGQRMIHRGPDAGGIYLSENIGLCHRRLSIIDLSESGTQPMISYDERYVIAFNGEIYNFLELREQLSDQGYLFTTQTDTEVLLALYEREGRNLLAKINGMFAFAIWDNLKQSLFIARDRIGKKPLYFCQRGNDIAFASELKSLLALPSIPREIRMDALYDFFAYQYVPDPKTIFQNIFKLEPGHYLEITQESFKKTRYWDISFANVRQDDEKTLKKELQQLIDECTRSRMMSDVPLGAFLSGGVDSSGIVARMAKNSDKPITTCSIGFDEKKFNETEFARSVAEQYGTDHHEFTVQQHVKENLEKIVSYFDEPFADPSLVPTYYVSQLARQKVTVAIAGDGGDEVFAGYQKYVTDDIENKLRSVFPSFIRKSMLPGLAKLFSRFSHPVFRKGASLFTSLSHDPAMGFYVTNSQITDGMWNRISTEETRQAVGNYHPSTLTIDNYNRCDGSDHLAKILYTDMKTYLPGGILVKVDRMSMANSLEVRAPILDYHLIEFAAKLPSELKYNKGEKKYLLKEAFKDDLTDDILYRKKMGFSVPLAEWLRGEIKELTETTLFEASNGISNYFDMQAIRKIWQQHQSEKIDHSIVLWSLLMFQMWWNQYMQDEPGTSSLSGAALE
jgi:asparagine synthase (glutamine-hydrolysing)